MNRPQVTTTVGISGLTVSVTKLLALFGDYKLHELSEALQNIEISQAGLALLGVLASSYGIYYNDKKETN